MTKRRWHAFPVCFLAVFLAGCSHHKQARVDVPAPPSISAQPPLASAPEKEPAKTPAADSANKPAENPLSVPPDTVPILSETGLASWYGAPYHNRRSSNGEIYNLNAMTASHRPRPLGSVVRVTNVKSGQSALLKITDRGPFVDGRIIDV